MDVAALTFRAEKELIEAIRAYAVERGQSVNAALNEIIAPVVGFVRRRSAALPRNNLARFCGALKDVDCADLEESQKVFSKIDEEMWK
jgi:hypothetical protein